MMKHTLVLLISCALGQPLCAGTLSIGRSGILIRAEALPQDVIKIEIFRQQELMQSYVVKSRSLIDTAELPPTVSWSMSVNKTGVVCGVLATMSLVGAAAAAGYDNTTLASWLGVCGAGSLFGLSLFGRSSEHANTTRAIEVRKEAVLDILWIAQRQSAHNSMSESSFRTFLSVLEQSQKLTSECHKALGDDFST